MTVGIVGLREHRLTRSRDCWRRSARAMLATRRHPDARRRRRARTSSCWASTSSTSSSAPRDVVVVAAPLTEETAGLIGAHELQEMREDA